MAIPYKFQIKTLDEIKDQIFSNNNETSEILENASLLNGFDLFTYFPARYQNTNKKALLNDVIEKKKYEPSKHDILITRFCPKKLPTIYTAKQHNDLSNEYTFISNVFNYKSTKAVNTIEWHMNFANCDIFYYYYGNLLAQDELQVLECPELASLREYLIQQPNHMKLFNTRVYENESPYPILISNVERVIDLNTTDLYGNNFSSSSKSTVLKSYKYLKPPQLINIIAIEAPKYGRGSYTAEQIHYILTACFTAYSAAKALAHKTYKLNKQRESSTDIPLTTYIHIGWFGCGAYGGNRTIMIILQILAAKMASIDKLIFHTVTDNYQQEKCAAEIFLQNIFDKEQNQLTIDELIRKIVNENFQWGLTNGT